MSIAWIEAMKSLQMPLGSSLGALWIADETVADARNQLCKEAIARDSDYVFFLGDDVLPPNHTLLTMLDKIGRELPDRNGNLIRADMITGVYWTRTYPPEPYLYNGLLKGSYKDWKAGEFFPVDLAGCDCLLVPTAILREIEPPWFSQEWLWTKEQGQPSSIATEDFYFYMKVRRLGKYRLWADTSIQCAHEDRSTGQMFHIDDGMPQAGGIPVCGDEERLIAELGSGTVSPFWGENCKVTRFDLRDDVKPDVRADIANIPARWHGLYDIVHARHVLEHFARSEAPALMRHWCELLKPGGQVIIRVPNIELAMKRIMDGTPDTYSWGQLYGGQSYPLDYHKNGFTKRKLEGLLNTVPGLSEVSVVFEDEDDQNLCGTATYHPAKADVLLDWWNDIQKQEGGSSDSAQQPAGDGELEPIEPLVTVGEPKWEAVRAQVQEGTPAPSGNGNEPVMIIKAETETSAVDLAKIAVVSTDGLSEATD
tara:strand:- start:8768 stop:10210 length:1443 start_codon:yes stop_codon:yes gene_type:complete